MVNVELILDVLLKSLRGEKDFEDMVITEINGNYFSAADIAVRSEQGAEEVFRIAVVKHGKTTADNIID